MRIALLGANGQLGHDLTLNLTCHEVVPFVRTDFDLSDHPRAADALRNARPDVIVNTTAYHRVDDCESQAELAYKVNVLDVLNLSRIANEVGAKLVHFSTDYVFDGNSTTGYLESSTPMPLSVYGNSKLAGEFIVRSVARRHMVIRTAGLYGRAGSRGKGGNFVETMLTKAAAGDKIRVVADQTTTPTHTSDLAAQVANMIEHNVVGLFHATNEGSCSWFEFAEAIFELAGVPADLSPTTTEQYKSPALRPRFSVLENARLSELGLNRMQHWRPAIEGYLRLRKA